MAPPPELRKMLFCDRFHWKPWEYDRAPMDLIVQWEYMTNRMNARQAELRANLSSGATPDHPVTIQTATGTATTHVVYFDEPD